jgi:hypothetical protein
MRGWGGGGRHTKTGHFNFLSVNIPRLKKRELLTSHNDKRRVIMFQLYTWPYISVHPLRLVCSYEPTSLARKTKTKLNSVVSVREKTIQTERPPLIGDVSANFYGQRTRNSGSVARNSDRYTTEAVYFLLHNIYKFSSYFTGNTIHLCCVARNSDH